MSLQIGKHVPGIAVIFSLMIFITQGALAYAVDPLLCVGLGKIASINAKIAV